MFLAMLGTMLATMAGELVIRAIIGIGVGLATYTLVIIPVKAAIADQFAHAGVLVGYVGFLGIDKAITIVLSAWVGRLVVSSAKVHLVKK